MSWMAFIVVSAGVFWAFVAHQRHAQRTRIVAEERVMRQRIAHPDWKALEQHLSRPVPESLKAFYLSRMSSPELGLRFSDAVYVSELAPIDERGHTESRAASARDIFAFAYTGAGDLIHLEPGSSTKNMVHITFVDGGDTESTEAMVDDFLRQLREPNGQ